MFDEILVIPVILFATMMNPNETNAFSHRFDLIFKNRKDYLF